MGEPSLLGARMFVRALEVTSAPPVFGKKLHVCPDI